MIREFLFVDDDAVVKHIVLIDAECVIESIIINPLKVTECRGNDSIAISSIINIIIEKLNISVCGVINTLVVHVGVFVVISIDEL